MFQIKNISKEYGTNQILNDVSFTLDKKEKIAVVGKNGSGKSTLLKILAGIEEKDSGEMKIPNGSTIAYLPQVIEVKDNNKTPRDYINENPKKATDFEIKKLTKVFKLEEKILDKPIIKLSGGQKTKVAIISILLTNAEFILLDEPTNNLDIATVLWMEDFIKKSNSSFIIVSHDRKFLDNVSNKVIEITEEGTINIEKGSYTQYLERQKQKRDRQKDIYENQQSEIGRLEKTINEKKKSAAKGAKYKGTDNDKLVRNFKREQAKGSAKEAKRIEKRIDQMDEIDKPKNERPLEINITNLWSGGNETISARDLVVGIENFKAGPFNFDIKYGDKICFVGSNGIGKTTLLKTILGKEPISGEISVGSAVSFGNITQEHENLPEEKTLIEFIKDQTEIEQHLIYNLLKKFNFREDQFKKKIETLSPGEKTRLILALFSEQAINTIVLDEPSNHLDMDALSAIEEAISSYEGTVIIVSHDRYLIEKIKPNKIYEVTKDKLISIVDYDEYLKNLNHNLQNSDLSF